MKVKSPAIDFFAIDTSRDRADLNWDVSNKIRRLHKQNNVIPTYLDRNERLFVNMCKILYLYLKNKVQ